ncbi:hypothetical protein TNCV_2900371 [Trichonephila clavipes]|nr:hypothetical protein TNCV_2900371 [Trichonephila clavipes]
MRANFAPSAQKVVTWYGENFAHIASKRAQSTNGKARWWWSHGVWGCMASDGVGRSGVTMDIPFTHMMSGASFSKGDKDNKNF